jgi:potassium efflux system protein
MLGRAAAIAVALAFAGGPVSAPAQEPLMLPPAPVAAAPAQPPSDPVAGLDGLKTALEEIESSYKDSAHSEDALVALKDRLAPVRDQLDERLGKLEPRLKAIDERAAQLAKSTTTDKPPEANAPEDPAVTAERQRLAARRTEVETALQQTRLLADTANNLEERIRHRRREVFSSRLFARSASLFDPAFWGDLAPSIPAEFDGLAVMLSSWGAYAWANGGIGGAGAALALLSVLGVAAWFLARWRRRLVALPTPRRFDKALVAIVSIAAGTARIPALIAAAVLVLRNFRLMPDSVAEIGFGLAVATMVAGFGRGVAAGLFAPGEPDRRIVALAEQEAATYASHLTWASRFFGLSILANEVHRILGASVAPFVATSELLAFAILALALRLLWRTATFSAVQTETAGPRLGWLRAILWLCSIAIAVGLATGYVGFAVFVATRVLAAFAVGGAVYILITTIDAALTDLLAPGTPGGRSIAVAFGLTPRGLDLIATLASALLRLVLAVLAVLLALNAIGVLTDDIYSAMQRVASDYDVGNLHISPLAILSALACIVIGALAVRAVQRWLAVSFLPRTGLDSGLQNSIVALSGYFALIVVVAVALGILGIDLQKIALIAGALSVGIGFGLQSVVSNFVSGLILLAERSIRVGDWVVVKNEEGFVRRISIRATEIETFDRASVIIPNQDFITGVVKNLTRGNTMGRVLVKVRVAFDSDAEKVREVLRACGEDHPQVMRAPPPMVYLMGIGDIGLEFELRCLIANVEQSIAVSTELRLEILRRFAQHAIRIAFLPHDARTPGPSAVPATGTH